MEAKNTILSGILDHCVLLAAQPRSGTSLLTSMLRTSGALLQAFELHIRKPSFVVGNDGRYTRNILKQTGLPVEEYDRIIEDHRDLFPRMNLGAWTGPKEEVSAEQLTGNETTDFQDELVARMHLAAALLRRASQLQGFSRWGFKILGDVIYSAEYATALPNAIVILLARDPRDHALSIMKLNEQRLSRGQKPFYENYAAVARGWLQTIRDGRKSLESSGLRYVLLRYEDLVAMPEIELARLGSELDIDLSCGSKFYQESFIEGHVQRFQHHDNLKNPVNANSVGKWRSQMSAEEAECFLSIAGKEMEWWGYD